MTLIKAEGDLFESPALGLVNAVNCVGVAGAGLALQFRNRWPVQMREYTAFCEAGKMRPGVVHDILLPGGKRILNVATKRHWKDSSHIYDVSAGLAGLRRYLDETGLASVALPPLGCGLGGLPKREVAHLVRHWLGDSTADVHVYGLSIGEG